MVLDDKIDIGIISSLFIVLLSVSFISSFEYDNPYLPHIEADEITTTETNFSEVNVNNSDYLDSYDSSEFWKTSVNQENLTGDKNGTFNIYTYGTARIGNASGLDSDTSRLIVSSGGQTSLAINSFDAIAQITFKSNFLSTYGVNRWQIRKETNNDFSIVDSFSSRKALYLKADDGINTNYINITGDKININSGNLSLFSNFLCNATNCYSFRQLLADNDTQTDWTNVGFKNVSNEWNGSQLINHKIPNGNFTGWIVNDTNAGTRGDVWAGVLEATDGTFSLGGFWAGVTYPSFTNYAFLDGGGGASVFNAQTNLDMRILNDNKIRINNTGVFITSPINQSGGNVSIINYYGEMTSHNDTGYIIDLTTQNVYVNIHNQTAGYNNGFSFSQNSILTAQASGLYKIDYSISFLGALNSEFGVAVGINGTAQNKTHSHVHLSVANSEVSSSGTGILRLNKGENITLMVNDEEASVNDPTIVQTNLNLLRIAN